MLVGFTELEVGPLPSDQVYPEILPSEMFEVFENWTTVLMQLDGGVKTRFGNGKMVMLVVTESEQPLLDVAFSFTV